MRTGTLSCHSKCRTICQSVLNIARLSGSWLNWIRWWPTGLVNLIYLWKRAVSGFPVEYRQMLLKACFLGIVCIGLPMSDCRLIAWKSRERARQSNKREVIGWGVNDQNSICCAALAKGCSKVNSTKTLALKKNVLWKNPKGHEQIWLKWIVWKLCCVKRGDKWKALNVDNIPLSLQEDTRDQSSQCL